MKLYRYGEIEMMGAKSATLIAEAKKNMIMVLPNINNELMNYDFTLPMGTGCQFIGMKFQNFDNNMHTYNEMFNEQGNFAFAQKPKYLRQDKQPQRTYTKSRWEQRLADLPTSE